MIKRIVLTISLLIIITVFSCWAQTSQDSLWAVWENTSQEDTSRLKAISKFTWKGYLFTKPDSAFYFAQLQYEFAENVSNRNWMADALYAQGVSFYLRGEYTQSLKHFNNCLIIREETANKKGIAYALNGIGLILEEQGDHVGAIRNYTRTLKILEEIGNKGGMASCMNNIGNIYQIHGDTNQALHYYNQSLKINEEMNDKESISSSLNNIGIIYKDKGDYIKALELYYRSVEIAEEIGDDRYLSNALINIGNIYVLQANYKEALEYFTKSLKIKKKLNDKQGISMALVSLATTYELQKDYSKAISYARRALYISKEEDFANVTQEASGVLYESYKAMGNNPLALEMYELYITTRDKILSEENQREVLRQEYKYNYEKQYLADSLDFAKNEAISSLELEESENQKSFLLMAAILTLLLAGFIFYGLRQKQKANIFLEERNKFEIENKKKAINLFGQQVSKEVALELLSDSFKSGSKKLFACIMFLDIRNFTPFVAGMEPDEIIQYQNDVFGFMIDVISKHHGIVNQFMGDGFMATFGAPLSSGNDCQNAVNASIEIIDILHRKLENAELPKTKIGIGIHAGNIVTGNVGTTERKQYSITGNTVILASRIEQLNKKYKSEILISKEVLDKLDSSDFETEHLGSVNLKGRTEPIEIVRLLFS